MDENKSDVFVPPPLVVGFEDEALKIMERLVGKPKHLDVISIVGMPGIGKTTLALKVYNDPYVAHHFYIRAWIPVSQLYEKRDLLLGILRSLDIMINPSQCDQKSDDELKETLYQRLKGNRYLILLDDLWDIEAWEYLKRPFPNDKNGSRIMFTSRIRDVALRANSIPHDMRFLSPDESWDLFHEKVFDKEEKCPPELVEVGKNIVENCRGLPLAIVAIGGLLAKREKTKEWWTQVGKSIASYVVSDSNQATKSTLELSYNHLSDHLKPLFLYFGAFPEDYEIPVSKMIWLWIAEGFIKESGAGGAETVEDVAERYLMDLIERSLILIANRRCDGGVKSCRIHDLLRDLCLRKAEEESFMKIIINRFERLSSTIPSSSSSPSPFLKFNRLSVCDDNCFEIPFDCRLKLCSFLAFTSRRLILFTTPKSPQFLRVLDLNLCPISFKIEPSEIGELVNLRYLRLVTNSILPSVFKLKKVEILILEFPKQSSPTQLDNDIFQMIKLRHLHIDMFYPPRWQSSNILADLQSISTPIFFNSDYTFLLATPNLRKLKCFCDIGPIPELGFLVKLEKLNMTGNRSVTKYLLEQERSTTFMCFDLPASLRRITLSEFRYDWEEISKLARLPNLEVLKLENYAFSGYLWDTSLLESSFQPFPKLKFLKFESLEIVQWNASVDHFPSLQRLVVNSCLCLADIPSDLGDIPTLKTIEVIECSDSVDCSARKILEEQQAKGNEQLEIFVKARKFSISWSESRETEDDDDDDEDDDDDDDGGGLNQSGDERSRFARLVRTLTL